MSVEDLDKGKQWLNDTFYLIRTETEYVSQMLTKIKRFAHHHSCHVWFVAHPRQLHHWVGGPPNLYDISGSAHFINKCDNGIVIQRNRDPEAGPIDQVQESSKSIQIEAFHVFKLFAANQHKPPDIVSILVANRSKLLRLFADFKMDKEDEQFEADKAQVVREIAALEPKEGP